MPEVIQVFTPELIMENTETQAIANTLEAILSGQQPLPSAEDCREYVLKNFDWRNISQQVREVLLRPID